MGFWCAPLTIEFQNGYDSDMSDPTPSKPSSTRKSGAPSWFAIGIGVKRWFGMLSIGVICVSLALALLINEIYQSFDHHWFQIVTLQFVPRPVRALFLLGLGVPALVIASRKLRTTLIEPFLPSNREALSMVIDRQRRGKGAKIVAIGGGTGMSNLLRGLKTYSANLTAIVTVADDGGSSGRLRQALGVLPPGDFRNCLAALADDEALITQLFQYRFKGDQDVGGHSFGNLFITAMSDITGSFEMALLEAGQVLAIQGRVLPSTLQNVTLYAEMRQPDSPAFRVAGESAIPESQGKIDRVYLQPDRLPAYPESIQAILQADLIIAGPGSLYTSVLPNLLIPDIAAAIKASKALKVYVCNTASQPGETDGFSVADHIAAIEKHTDKDIFPFVLANHRYEGELRPSLNWVRQPAPLRSNLHLVETDLVDIERPWRHDTDKLAAALLRLLEQVKAVGK